METVIEFKDVHKIFYLSNSSGIKETILHFREYLKNRKKRRFVALKGISFKVEKGESLGIIGHNGAGKSTILGLIAGVIKPDKGKVVVKGNIAPLLELGAGFHPELTGRENIILNSIILGMTKKEALNKTDEIIEFSGLSDFIDQPIRTYSSGMLARLGFSVAVHTNPDILLIDEILAVGDEEFQKKCLDKIKSFKNSGVTIVFVSHNIEQVNQISDRVIKIDKGKIVEEYRTS